jgi:hypothetical protein
LRDDDNIAHQDAVEQLRMESFDVRMLDEPDTTLFVIAPNMGTVAGATVALIDSIIRYFRRKTANHQLTHRLLLELDEACNACKLPDLLTYVGESAGLGVNISPPSRHPHISTWFTAPNTLTRCAICSLQPDHVRRA